MTGQLLVIAKAPVAGRVKTRLCPPYTPPQAARLAGAALADTLDAVRAAPAKRRVLLLAGALPAPAGFTVVAQRGDGLGARLAAGFADTALPGSPSFLVGMDTPQLSAALLRRALDLLAGSDAVLGPAADGGWWGLGLRDPGQADVLRDVPMSTPDTGALTRRALTARGLRVTELPRLRDVDTAGDAAAVAALAPGTRFAATVAALDRHRAAVPGLHVVAAR